MKISFVATVYNEEKTIGTLLESLLLQSRLPDEIVIVDGGSTDSTVSIITNFTSEESRSLPRHHPRCRVITRPALTIAQGRNYGIERATGEIIAMSDAGCTLYNDWLEKITEPFEKENTDIVAGFYRMIGSTPLQKALAVYLGIPPKRFDQNKFLPSARSIAFKKSLWEKVGGFNERLERAGEDTLFNYEAIKLGAKFVRAKDALVDWEVPKSLWEGIKKFYVYAKGDVQADIWWHPMQRMSTHNLKVASIFVRYLIAVVLIVFSFVYSWLLYILFIGFLFYIYWSIWKMRDVVTDYKTKLWLPIVQVSSDIAVVSGTIIGLLKRLWDTQKIR